MRSVKETAFTPTMYYDAKTNAILDFSALPMLQFEDTQTYTKKNMESVSELLEQFYYERDHMYHIKQKSADMRRVIQSNIDRCLKKRDVLFRTRKDTKNMEVWKKKGELITANIYSIEKGMTKFSTIDFYKEDTPMIEITLDATKSPSENAQKYFANYNKAKRTLVALEVQEKQNEEELQYLESVLNALESARDLADLAEIRNELVESGFLKKVIVKKGAMKQQKAKPMHYISSDGFHMYVGKSNLQNDELTLRFAQSTDIWLHTKEIPGSHVIIATNGTGTVPDTTLTEAGTLAAFFSRSRQGSMVPVDYTLRKNIKKPNGSKPGMVIYLTNQTMYITPSEEAVNQLEIIE
ncbi:MAG: NFACT family protein, partial [Bacillota bacterium]